MASVTPVVDNELFSHGTIECTDLKATRRFLTEFLGLDIIREARTRYNLPISAYQVSGEYSMIMAAAQNGWIDLDRAMLESLTSIRRAGAGILITYSAKDVARWLG